MMARTSGYILLLAVLPVLCSGQAAPHLSKTPSATDTQLSGTAQRLTAPYDSVSLYVCASQTEATAVNCTVKGAANEQRAGLVQLVNLGTGPFAMTAVDDKFTITMTHSFAPGTYVWLVQVTRSAADPSGTALMSAPVRIRVPLLSAASFSLTGYDSASRDIGGKVTLDLGHGLWNEGWGETGLLISGSYDDKWKHSPLSSNVTQNYYADLFQLKQFQRTMSWGPSAAAYHNNTLGIRVEQTYGAGITETPNSNWAKTWGLSLSVGMEALLENLYSPGTSVNLGGVHVSGELNPIFGNKWSVDMKLEGAPVFTQSRAWNATGDFTLLVPVSQHWSVKFTVLDHYYEIAPKTFNKNYLEPSIGLSFK